MTEPRGTILLVDDAPENLRILAEMLQAAGLSPRPVSSAKAALKLLETVSVDVILLDINMPEMSGFDLCLILKNDARHRDIPVLFLSAAQDTAHKLAAFRCGGVDYITKPFQREEVLARVETHLHIRRLQAAERGLLDRTLAGTVQMLVDCLQMASPRAFDRSHVVRLCMDHMATRLDVNEQWAFSLSGSLAFIGCLALPESVVDDALVRGPVPEEAERRFRHHAALGRKMLQGIPRLEAVAAIVGAQYDEAALPEGSPNVVLAARALRVAQAYCRLVFAGRTPEDALRSLESERPWDVTLLDALVGFRVEAPTGEPVEGSLQDLVVGSQIVRPVTTTDGLVLLTTGQELTPLRLMRLEEYVRSGKVSDRFLFRPPLRPVAG